MMDKLMMYNLKSSDNTKKCLALARTLALSGSCSRRNYGAVLWKPHDERAISGRVVSVGSTTVPTGVSPCTSSNCLRTKLGVPSGERYELCKSIHAEWSALLNCSPEDARGSILFLYGVDDKGDSVDLASPCSICERLIKYAGVIAVVRFDAVNLRTDVLIS